MVVVGLFEGFGCFVNKGVGNYMIDIVIVYEFVNGFVKCE